MSTLRTQVQASLTAAGKRPFREASVSRDDTGRFGSGAGSTINKGTTNPGDTGKGADRLNRRKTDPRNRARPGSKQLQEDEIPMRNTKTGARLVDFNGAGTGSAIYSDGSVYDGQGWQKKGKKF